MDLGFYRVLRNIALDQGTELTYVIATRQDLSQVERHLEQRFTSLSSPLFNIFHTLVIPTFSEDDARQMVSGLLESAGLDLSAKLSFWFQRDLLFHLSGFHPFFLQIACYELFEHCVLPDGTFSDQETGSIWDILGEAIDGPLKGTLLSSIPNHDTFWFAWAAFVPPDTLAED